MFPRLLASYGVLGSPCIFSALDLELVISPMFHRTQLSNVYDTEVVPLSFVVLSTYGVMMSWVLLTDRFS